MRVILMTAYFAPEVSSVTHLLSDLADDLSAYGAEVTVVTNLADRGLSAAEKAAYLDRTDEVLPSGVRVLRVGRRSRESGGLARRALRFLTNTLALYRRAKRVPTDVYLINSMPPYLGLVGAWLNKARPTIYILQDLFPDSVIAMGGLKEGSLIARLFRAMEKRTYRDNTFLVTISPDMQKTLLDKGLAPDKLSVIENWVDAGSIHPVPRAENPLFDELSLDRNGFYALYAGALGKLQDPDALLDAAKLTKEKGITYLVFGSGGQEARLRDRIEQEGIKNLLLFPVQPVSRVSEVYSMGDVALVTLKKGVTAIALPSKTWTAMAAGRFTICAADPGSRWEQMITLSGGGVSVPPENPAALADAVAAAYENRAALPGLGLRARAFVEMDLPRSRSTERYFNLLSEAKARWAKQL